MAVIYRFDCNFHTAKTILLNSQTDFSAVTQYRMGGLSTAVNGGLRTGYKMKTTDYVSKNWAKYLKVR